MPYVWILYQKHSLGHFLGLGVFNSCGDFKIRFQFRTLTVNRTTQIALRGMS